jgi:hypothetical protein
MDLRLLQQPAHDGQVHLRVVHDEYVGVRRDEAFMIRVLF